MLNDILKDAVTIAIGGHIRPDGDCVGSCIGLYQYIRENDPARDVDVYLEEVPESFDILQAVNVIRHEISSDKEYDLFISLDCSEKERLGFSVPLFEHAKKTCCIDHHISNHGFAQENYIEPDFSSTSELVCGLMDIEKISMETANALYMGIVHDTGVFQYSNTSARTLRTAADLLEKGINAADIIMHTFYEKSYAQNQILGRVLLESILFMGGKCIAAYVTKKTMDFYGVKAKDLEGIVSQLRVTQGVEVAVFMYELEPSVFKVSLRSNTMVDVSRVAEYFGGGGHRKAAGLTMTGSPYDVINNLSEQIALQIESMEEE